jgi:hypothetical protein
MRPCQRDCGAPLSIIVNSSQPKCTSRQLMPNGIPSLWKNDFNFASPLTLGSLGSPLTLPPNALCSTVEEVSATVFAWS